MAKDRTGRSRRVKQTDKIRGAYNFLIERAEDGKPFTLDDLQTAADWKETTMDMMRSKKLRELLRKDGSYLYARPEMLRVRYNEFEDLFNQRRRLFAEYDRRVTDTVLVYEFFMPLTREHRLREALDNLFYREAIEQRSREIGLRNIREKLCLPDTMPDKEVQERVVRFMEETIGGYSLSIVSGRFRAGPLATRNEAADRPQTEGPYLVDETTAVVRFILPVNVRQLPVQRNLFDQVPPVEDANELAEQMSWLFMEFFAEAITRVVRNEDEIWLLESGMKSRLYQWVLRE